MLYFIINIEIVVYMDGSLVIQKVGKWGMRIKKRVYYVKEKYIIKKIDDLIVKEKVVLFGEQDKYFLCILSYYFMIEYNIQKKCLFRFVYLIMKIYSIIDCKDKQFN